MLLPDDICKYKPGKIRCHVLEIRESDIGLPHRVFWYFLINPSSGSKAFWAVDTDVEFIQNGDGLR